MIFCVTSEVISQSPVLPGQQNPALFLLYLVQSILSHLVKAAIWMNTNTRFGWNARMVQQSPSVLFHKSASRLDYYISTKNHLILWYIWIIFSKFYYGWMCQCYSLDKIKAWWVVSTSKQLSSKSMTISSNEANSTRGQRNIHPKFTNDIIFDTLQ